MVQFLVVFSTLLITFFTPFSISFGHAYHWVLQSLQPQHICYAPCHLHILNTNCHLQKQLRKCSVKKVFLEISQSSHENICTRFSFLNLTLAQIFSCELWHFKEHLFYITPLNDCFCISNFWCTNLHIPMVSSNK